MPGTAERTEFNELLSPQFDKLFGFALRMTQNRPDAEDLLQESIFRAFRGFSGFRRGTNFKAWMFRIVSNCFISSRRRAKRAPLLMDLDSVSDASTAATDEVADGDTNWDEIYGRVVEDEVKQALDELPLEFRAPLLLSSLGGLRYKEIAEALGVPIGTIMSRLFRARQRLRRSLRIYAEERGIRVAEGGAA